MILHIFARLPANHIGACNGPGQRTDSKGRRLGWLQERHRTVRPDRRDQEELHGPQPCAREQEWV